MDSLRTINNAETTYRHQNPTTGYVSLSNLGSAGLLDNVLGQDNATKSGYSFALTSTSSGYRINASPVSASAGMRYFFTDQSGVIHYNVSTTATTADPALQ